MKKIILSALFLSLFLSQGIFAQGSLKTINKFICAGVEGQNGFVTVLLPGCRIGFDPQLCFVDKCYFTCKIGNTYFTNNEVIAPFPANAKRLNDGTTIKIADTIRTTWLNKNGCDIIQDIYPVEFTKSGQIVYKWKIYNHSGATVSVPSQYLQDVQITDQNDPSPIKSNDGPKILTKWAYSSNWVQYPNLTFPSMPWFYIGFLRNLPSAPSYNPGLSAMGYLDYGAPLFLTKPFRMTNGDWYTMAQNIFGSNPQWPVNGNTSIGSDNAILLEFPGVGIPSGKTVEISRTSYGTGEYEKCIGQLFSLVFYPHHLVWTKSPPPPGSYSPNPIHIEKFVVVPGPPENNTASANTKITLTVGSHLTLSDSLCKTLYGKSQTKPDTGIGRFIAPGGVAYFDWWACADPEYFCTDPVYDSLKFTGACGFCPPAFLNEIGADECDQRILIDCAESDIDVPQFSDTLVAHDSASINVRDWRTTDRGLKSITWVPAQGTNPAKFIVKGPFPAITACYNDKINHRVTVVQLDSTIGGCFNFTFEDCLGHQSFNTVCMDAHPLVIARPDSLPPVFTFIKQPLNRDSCRNLVDSFEVSDNRFRDSGLCTLEVISGSDHNMIFQKIPFVKGDGIARFTVRVIDSLFDGGICIRATDCSKEAHYTDTCFRYCAAQNTNVAEGSLNSLSLEANNPNPFSHITTFSYAISEHGMVRLYLYDELGREMSCIVEKVQSEGRYTIDFDGSKLPSGSYIVRLESGGRVVSRKVVIDR